MVNTSWRMALFAVLMSAGVCAAIEIGPEVGKPSPNLIGRSLDDQSYSLRSDKGMPKVINFFSVSCKPCQKEMPELAKLEQQYPKVKFIAVHTHSENPENIAKFIKSLSGTPSHIVLTSGGLQEIFHYFGLPYTLVLDANNIVVMNLLGYTSNNMQRLQKHLRRLKPSP